MFYALAIVCDDFFVPSLEKICEVRRAGWAGRAPGRSGDQDKGTVVPAGRRDRREAWKPPPSSVPVTSPCCPRPCCSDTCSSF